ncbi:NAD(P)H-binding protein [Crossiella sp. SN42]|uniref:NAD(P)H-binding protein n=1 Tax=Crossiella sp. SN42 TaxID=2944808 RepID=UPI00207D16E9|nr:NAD(P)H-binding protein [Crossiella sp. SN42]MCO1579865.1 NAD(P)H-binding protein [Crossiella sp. SN42]
MRVVIAGGHGQIALKLEALLAARGDSVAGLIRNPEHAADLRAAGAEPVELDLESATVEQVAACLAGADAVVFAAGAGGKKSADGSDRKQNVDLGAAALLAEAAERAGVRRYLMISSYGADTDPQGDYPASFADYLRAKGQADEDLRGRDLDWTVLRPVTLTNEEPTGLVTLAAKVEPTQVSRADVAAVLLALLDTPATAGLTVELTAGDTPVQEAVATIAG